MTGRRIVLGRVLSFSGDPVADPAACRFIEDGAVEIEAGSVRRVGERAALMPRDGDPTPVDDWRPFLVVPGFIDPHVHMPQTQVIASYGADLLEWLERYTFPEERRYGDPLVADTASRFLLDTLLANGTTTAVAFCSVHAASADAFLAEAERRDLRMIAGKVMMDDGPPGLRDTAEEGYRDTKALIGRWQGRRRLEIAIAPRFAVTSSAAQLEAAGTLAREHPDLVIETHLAETLAEIEVVRARFPAAEDYTAVYEQAGLVRPRALFGHAIHLSERERRALGEGGASAISCPTSNLFLGSGLFDWRTMRGTAGIRVGLATDIGGGTSYSMLATAAAAYQTAALRGQRLSPRALFHLMTRGNAEALGLADRIGAIAPGFEADLAVLDARATPTLARRMERVASLDDELFALVTLGDERVVAATYAAGRLAHRRDGAFGMDRPTDRR